LAKFDAIVVDRETAPRGSIEGHLQKNATTSSQTTRTKLRRFVPLQPSPCRNHYHRGRSHILVHSFHLQRATCPTSILGIACYTRETYLRNVAAWSASYEAHLTDIRSIYPKKKILMNQRLPPNQHNVSLIYNASEAWTN
jgi:hypothetical protein